MKCVLFRDSSGWHWVIHRPDGTPVCHSGSYRYDSRTEALSHVVTLMPVGASVEIEDLSDEWVV